MTTLAVFQQKLDQQNEVKRKLCQYQAFVKQTGLAILAELQAYDTDDAQYFRRKTFLLDFFKFFGAKRDHQHSLIQIFRLFCLLIDEKAKSGNTLPEETWCEIAINKRKTATLSLYETLEIYSVGEIYKNVRFLTNLGLLKRRSLSNFRTEYTIATARFVELVNEFRGGAE